MKKFKDYLFEKFDLLRVDGETGPGYDLTQAIEEIIRDEAAISDQDSGIGSYEYQGAKGFDSRPYQISELPRNQFTIDVTDSLTQYGRTLLSKDQAYWDSFFRRHSDQGTEADWAGMTHDDVDKEWYTVFEGSFNVEPGNNALDADREMTVLGADDQEVGRYKASVLFLKKVGYKLIAGVNVSEA